MEVQITNGKRNWFRPVFWGLVLVLAAVVLILDGVGVQFGYGINAWRIIAGILLLAWMVTSLVRRQFSDIFIPLGLLFLVFEAPLAKAIGQEGQKLLPTWVVIVAAILLSIGFGFILKPMHTVSINGSRYDSNPGKIGNKVLYVNASELDGTVISDHLGTVQFYVKNAETYAGNAVVTISNNTGKVVLHLPNSWDVVTQTGDNLGAIDIPAHAGSSGQSVTLVIRDNLGTVQVLFDA